MKFSISIGKVLSSKKLFVGILFLFFLQSYNLFGQCIPTIEFTTTTGTLKGCAPFSVSFKDPNTSVSRTWDFGDGKPTSTSTTPFHIFESGVLGDTTYTVTMTKNCNGGAATQVVVTVYARPKVNFKVDTTSVCAINDQAKFTNLSQAGTYNWDFGDNTSSIQKNPIKTYSVGGVYDVQLTVTNAKGCEESKTMSKLMTVNSLPSPDFVLDNYSGCAPLPVTITNTTDVSAVSIKKWEWSLDNATPIDTTITPATIQYIIPGTKQISLTVTSILGCKSTTSNIVNVITSPSSDFLINPLIICTSDSALISYNGAAGINAIYNWNFNGGVSKSNNTKGPHWVNWDKGGIKTIDLTITDSTCSSNTSKQVTVMVSPIITLASTFDTICTGEEITFTTTPESLVDYKYYKNGSLIQSGADNLYTSSLINDGDVFYVVGYDVKGCSSKKSDNKPIKVKVKPTVSLLYDQLDTIICQNDPVVFTGNPTNYKQYTFFNFSESLQSGLSSTLLTSSLEDGDSIFVEATNLNGCRKTSSNAYVMHVIPKLPKPVVNCSNSTTSQIAFAWDTIPGAIGYEVSINGGAFQTPSNGSLSYKHILSGVNSGDTAKIIVRAIGQSGCGTSLVSDEKACSAVFCDPIKFNYKGYDTICKGKSVVLNLSNLNSSSYSVAWNGGTANLDTTYRISPTNDIDIHAILIDSLTLATCPPQDVVFKIKVNQIPTVTLTSSQPTTSCDGVGTILTAIPSNYEKYTFYNGNSIIQNNWKNSVSVKKIKNAIPLKVVATEKGCTSTSNVIVNNVIKPLDQPVVNCGTSSTSSIEFKWDQVTGAIGYQVSIDGGAWITPTSGNTGLRHVLNGLNPGTAAYISVKALGSTICGNSQISLQSSCFTSPCTAISFNTQNNLSICEGTSVDVNISSISIPNYLVSFNRVNYNKTLAKTIKPTKDTVVIVTVKNQSELNCPFSSKFVRIEVIKQPNVTLSVVPSINCSNDSINLIASPVDYDLYKFYNGSALISSGYQNFYKSNNIRNGSLLKVVARNGNCIDTSNVVAISIDDPLERPIINSGNITDSTIEFVWDSVPKATGYMISIDGSPYITPTSGITGRSHVITGLLMNQIKVAKVIALGNGACGNSLESDTIHRHTTDNIDSVCTAIKYDLTYHTSICDGNNIKLRVTNINNSTSVISWDNQVEDTVTSYIITPSLTDTVVVKIRRTDEPFCPAVTKLVRVVVNPKPFATISSSINNDSICEQDAVTFTVLPTGFSNYLFKNGSNTLQTSNSNEYVINHITQSVQLEVIVTDDIGCTGNSAIFPLVMVPKPVVAITSNAVNSGICAGSDLKINATPTNFETYKFYDNGIEVQSGSNKQYVQSALSKPYLITANAIHSFGCVGNITSPLNIKLFSLPVVTLVTSDVDNSICDGDNITFTASPPKMASYNFYEGATSVQNTNSQNKVYVGLNIPKTLYVIATDTNTCVSAASNSVSVVVNPIPSMSSSSIQIICGGNEVNIPLASAVKSNYTWIASDNPKIIGESTNLQNSNLLKDSLKSSSILQELVNYLVTPTSLAGCVGPSQNVQVKVNPVPQINNKIDTICSGSAFNFTPVNNQLNNIIPNGTKYTWTAPTESLPGILSGMSAQANLQAAISQTINNSNNRSGQLIYTVTPKSGTSGTCTGKSFLYTVNVDAVPNIPDYITDSLCSGEHFLKTPINGVPNASTIVPNGTIYTWSTPISIPNGAITGANNELVGKISVSDTLYNTTTNLAQTFYLVTPSSTICKGASFKIPIVVKPRPVVNSVLTKSQCSNLDVLTKIESNINATYEWHAIDNSFVSGESVQIQRKDSINDNLINHSNVVQQVTYSIIPTSVYGCVGNDTLLTVNINPVPTIANIHKILCDQDSLIVTPSVNDIVPMSTKYTWNMPIVDPKDSILGYNAQSVPGSLIRQKLSTKTISGSLKYSVTPISGDIGFCSGLPFDVSVDIHPIPNPTIKSDVLGLCKGEKVSIETSFDETYYPNSVYQWNSGQKTKNIEVNPSSTTTYKLTVTSNSCSSTQDSVTIMVDTNFPKANAGGDVTICRGDSISLDATGGKAYQWDSIKGIDLNHLTSATPKAAPYITTTYKVTVKNDYCYDTDEIKVLIDRCLKELPSKIPQIYSPNGDEANEVWELTDIDYFTKSKLLVFNRWGSIVYEIGPYLNTWNGKNNSGDDLPDGTYYYVLDLGNGHELYKGFVVITR